MKASTLLAAAAVAALTISGSQAAIPDEDWGYVDVRPGAHMFWWMYGCTGCTAPRENSPLVLWLQGGPGAGSTGYGNFGEMGPLDENLNPRNTSWVQSANVVFVDNPVGAGFSYVDDLSLLTTNNTQIAADMVALITAFLQKYPAFTTVPFFIFCESYGGKMTAGTAAALLAAQQAGKISVNFRGIALGDSWISPISFVDAWGPFLQANSMMDATDVAVLAPAVAACDAAVAAGKWAQATNEWGNVENVIEQVADGVGFYNILQGFAEDYGTSPVLSSRSSRRSSRRMSAEALALAPAGVDRDILQALYDRHVGVHYSDPLTDLMNGPIKQKLGVIPASVSWGGQSDAVFSALSGDFMRPVVDVVDALLAGGAINVTVYEGQVDLICCATGAQAWMSTLQWPGMKSFNALTKVPQYAYNGAQIGAFSKQYGPLSYWTVLQAGHMVPADQGGMALAMLQTILAAQS